MTRTQIEVTETFLITHSRNHDDFASESGKITHEVSARFDIEIPEEVASLLRSLNQSGKLYLTVSLTGQRFIDLRDKDTRNPFSSSDSSSPAKRKNLLRRVLTWIG